MKMHRMYGILVIILGIASIASLLPNYLFKVEIPKQISLILIALMTICAILAMTTD